MADLMPTVAIPEKVKCKTCGAVWEASVVEDGALPCPICAQQDFVLLSLYQAPPAP